MCVFFFWIRFCDENSETPVFVSSGLQTRSLLEELLAGVTKARDDITCIAHSRKPKIVLKIAPDLTEADILDIADVVKSSPVDGVIISNTTITRPSSLTHRKYSNFFFKSTFRKNPHVTIFANHGVYMCINLANKTEPGGLSGAPLQSLSLSALKLLRSHLPARIPLIGCGGISSGADALEFAKAGASFVQVYTSFGYDGAGTCRRIKDELTDLLRKEGTSWRQVVLKSTTELSLKESVRGDVSVLVEEAEELKKLLDGLGERIAPGGDETAAVPVPSS